MPPRKAARPAAGQTAREPRGLDRAGGAIGLQANPTRNGTQHSPTATGMLGELRLALAREQDFTALAARTAACAGGQLATLRATLPSEEWFELLRDLGMPTAGAEARMRIAARLNGRVSPMRRAGRWFRFYDSVPHDAKVQQLSDRHFRAWVSILCLASQHDGVLPSTATIAFALRCRESDVGAILDDLAQCGLLDRTEEAGWSPHNWRQRQFKDPTGAARARRYRQRKRGGQDDDGGHGERDDRDAGVTRDGRDETVTRHAERHVTRDRDASV